MDSQAIIDIAFHQGVLPIKGFDWVLQRFGICSAITVMGGELPITPEVRAACSKKLIRTLHTRTCRTAARRDRAAAEFRPDAPKRCAN